MNQEENIINDVKERAEGGIQEVASYLADSFVDRLGGHFQLKISGIFIFSQANVNPGHTIVEMEAGELLEPLTIEIDGETFIYPTKDPELFQKVKEVCDKRMLPKSGHTFIASFEESLKVRENCLGVWTNKANTSHLTSVKIELGATHAEIRDNKVQCKVNALFTAE